MKLKFKNQNFQTDAVNAVVDLFTGQDKRQSTFAVEQDAQMNLLQNDFGIGNALLIDKDTLRENMHAVQKRSNLPLTDDVDEMRFCVEMETGTGKTYVYTKTIFELHKRYGFTKFIIVVPSVAIREGVYKSFEITQSHFSTQYDNVPFRYFIYNSSKLSDVRQFATSSNIEIMIINIDAFKKAENIINQAHDKLNGETAMRYIQDTNPVVIVDEPQSVDNTPKAREAIESLNPLCVLRYSATHRDKINLLYRLTPVDAYQMGLVKQICVSSNTIESGFNKPYIRLLSVSMEKGFKAKVELDVCGKNGTVSRKTLTIKPGSDLYLLSGERELYEGYTVTGIDCTPGFECIEFGNTETVQLGKAIGSVDEDAIKRAQIRRTIETHLEKELRYYDMGIKVLSLFFIDEVAKYRTAEGEKGLYAKMFEECYEELMALPKFAELKNRFPSHDGIHDGYFSQDKKGKLKDTKGDTLADYDTYSTIMKDKEWLLSFDCPLRFIFSHSALKEGWDNPNVFQVCTLIEQKSTFTCRQKIGRGLRLCVNQEGERIEDKNINQLHVMANESFAEFADALQKEIEAATGVKFGTLQIELFSGIPYTETTIQVKTIDMADANRILEYMAQNDFTTIGGKPTEKAKAAIVEGLTTVPSELERVKGQIAAAINHDEGVTADSLVGTPYHESVAVHKTVSYEEAAELMNHFYKKGYISKTGKIKDTMKNALRNGTLDLPAKFEAARDRFEDIISRASKVPPIRDASRDVVVRLNKKAILSPEFFELWNKIKQKTMYRVQIDSEKLVEDCVKDLAAMPPIPKTRLVSRTADIDIRHEGITHIECGIRSTDVQDDYTYLPDILAIVSEEALLLESTVLEILEKSGRVADFVRNPQLFMENFLDIVKTNRHRLAIDGIRYVKLDGEEYYAQEIFGAEELIANLDKNAVAVKNSVYDHIIYDSSTVEYPFAVALNRDPDVKLFFKIPASFKIETPIGTYNPDWAVYVDCDGVKKMYFVLETKGTTNLFDLRGPEQLKIHCGKRHFKALENDVEFIVAEDWEEVKKSI